MELFSVSCITCRAKLQVKQMAAIGQILPCPKCGGLVQILPPAGWKPPPEPTPAPNAAGSMPSPQTPTTGPEVYTAQLADDPIAPPRVAGAPGDRRVRLALFGFVGLAALAIIGFGIWSSFGRSGGDVATDDTATDGADPSPSASPTPSAESTGPSATRPTATSPTASAAGPSSAATGSATAGIAPAAGSPSSSIAMSSGTAPTGTAVSGTVSPTAVASATAPRATPTPSGPMLVVLPTAGPTPSAAPTSTAMAAVLPAASATSTKPTATPVPSTKVASNPAGVDVAARMREKIPAVKFERVPLRSALAATAELAGVPLRYDWSTLPLDFRPDEPVSLVSEQATLGEVIERLTKERGLRVVAADGVLEIAGPVAEAAALEVVDFPIDDLFGDDPGAAESAGRLVKAFVAPDMWSGLGGGTLAAAPGKLVISQTPRIQAETALFLNRLRGARGKAGRAAAGVAATIPPTETRIARAKALLDLPVTMNFRPGAPLATILAHLETTTKVPIVVDYGALVAAGFSFDEPVGISAKEHPLGEVLDALCRPRAWGWHLVRESVIELTSQEAARTRMYVELYDVRPLLDEQTAEALTARVLDATSDLGWSEAQGRAAIGFDHPSGRMIVRQTQGGHFRLERLLYAWANPQAAPPTARPTGTARATATPTPSAPKPSPTAR